MKTIKLNKRDIDYLTYIFNVGFQIDDNQTRAEWNREFIKLQKLAIKLGVQLD